jgi:negative regulator of genetic competence, sporulation and motility
MGVNGLKIEKMGQETIKVTVLNTELAGYGIAPGSLTGDNMYTHTFFTNVFGEIKRKFSVELKGLFLYLEVFTIMEDRTYIYISMMNEPDIENEEKLTYVCFSDSLEDLSRAAKDIVTQTDKSIESRFYISDEGYFLVVKTEAILSLCFIGSSDYCAEYIEEHFEVVEEENAVDKLAGLMF